MDLQDITPLHLPAAICLSVFSVIWKCFPDQNLFSKGLFGAASENFCSKVSTCKSAERLRHWFLFLRWARWKPSRLLEWKMRPLAATHAEDECNLERHGHSWRTW